MEGGEEMRRGDGREDIGCDCFHEEQRPGKGVGRAQESREGAW